jgi:hypothetical protein
MNDHLNKKVYISSIPLYLSSILFLFYFTTHPFLIRFIDL